MCNAFALDKIPILAALYLSTTFIEMLYNGYIFLYRFLLEPISMTPMAVIFSNVPYSALCPRGTVSSNSVPVQSWDICICSNWLVLKSEVVWAQSGTILLAVDGNFGASGNAPRNKFVSSSQQLSHYIRYINYIYTQGNVDIVPITMCQNSPNIIESRAGEFRPETQNVDLMTSKPLLWSIWSK